jgi:L-2-hydroxyglutarate oxidase LhgO
VLRAPVTGGAVTSDGIRVEVGGAEPTTLMPWALINCAGHGAVPLARRIVGLPESAVPRAYFRRGVYFSVTSRPFAD